MLLKFLISPSSIIITAATLLLITGTMIFISKYLKSETKRNLYNNLEYLHRKKEEVEEEIIEAAEEYQQEYKREIDRRNEKKNKRRRRKIF